MSQILETIHELIEAMDYDQAITLIKENTNVVLTTKTIEIFNELDSQPELTRLILERGVSPDKGYYENITPLHRAAEFYDVETIKVVLDFNPDVNVKNRNGNTPINCLFDNDGDATIMNMLLKAGADIDTQDNDGNTPLHKSVSEHYYFYLIETLVENKANLELKNNKGLTPLVTAIKNHNDKAASFLIENGANFDYSMKFWSIREGHQEKTLLMKATENNMPDTIAKMLEKNEIFYFYSANK